jgi:hypothetical protein
MLTGETQTLATQPTKPLLPWRPPPLTRDSLGDLASLTHIHLSTNPYLARQLPPTSNLPSLNIF